MTRFWTVDFEKRLTGERNEGRNGFNHIVFAAINLKALWVFVNDAIYPGRVWPSRNNSIYRLKFDNIVIKSGVLSGRQIVSPYPVNVNCKKVCHWKLDFVMNECVVENICFCSIRT